MRTLYIAALVFTTFHTAHAGALNLVYNIRNELSIFVVVGVGLAMVLFIMGLIGFLASAGDQSAHDKGRQRMVWGIIALFFMVSIWGIVNILQTMLGAGWNQGCTPTKIQVNSSSGGPYIDECL
jgi:predicted RND superfamily exporter protein